MDKLNKLLSKSYKRIIIRDLVIKEVKETKEVMCSHKDRLSYYPVYSKIRKNNLKNKSNLLCRVCKNIWEKEELEVNEEKMTLCCPKCTYDEI